MTFSVVVTPGARGDLLAHDPPVRDRVISRLRWLVDNFESVRPEPLAAAWQGYFEFRVVAWRIVYSVNREEKILTIIRVAHRREVYLT
ncbi:MAG: type II toxin-antitoxin system RelE/ParE family toxin [Anaerolineae bacterium]|nr:type II toxin-antitoxin system RelE/ParE family toxin [Anaerolineae bacterium]